MTQSTLEMQLLEMSKKGAKLTVVLSELLIFHVFWVPVYVHLSSCCQP